MEKKQTAVKQFIDRLQNLHDSIPDNTEHNMSIKGAYLHSIMIAKHFLIVEEYDINESYTSGFANALHSPLSGALNDSQYYTQTFKP